MGKKKYCFNLWFDKNLYLHQNALNNIHKMSRKMGISMSQAVIILLHFADVDGIFEYIAKGHIPSDFGRAAQDIAEDIFPMPDEEEKQMTEKPGKKMKGITGKTEDGKRGEADEEEVEMLTDESFEAMFGSDN